MSVDTITRPQRVDTSNPPLSRQQVEEAWDARAHCGRFIGEGSYRKCVLSACGNWVYKFMYDYDLNFPDMNRREYEVYLEIRDEMPSSIIIPEMHFIPGNPTKFGVEGDVIVAEYLKYFVDTEDDRSESRFLVEDTLAELGVEDISPWNLLVSIDRSVYAIVDLGGYDS